MTTQALRAPAVTVNGELAALGDISVHTTVLDWLRERHAATSPAH